MGLIEPEKRVLGNLQENFPYDANFRQLNEMVRDGNLDIKLILANPRTGSTLLEASFAQNATINTHVHEPFQGSNNTGDAQKGYKTIFERVKPEAKASLQPVRIIVKEISRGLTIGNEYQRFLTLVDSPPILLVRNPLLNTESKIRAVLKSLDLRKSTSLQDVLLNYYARTMGYDDVNTLLRSHHDETPSDDPESQISLQNHLLNHFATFKEYKDWQSMLEETFASQNYKPFENILIDERIYKLEPSATLEQMYYLQSIGRSFIVVDSSDFRLDPQAIVPSLCERWNMPFSDNMIEWGDNGEKLHTGQPNLSVWFERIQNSKRIDQPYEISPVLADFPDFIANYLKDVELPAYYEMFTHSSRVKPTKASLQKQIDVPIAKGIYHRLQEIGLLPPELNLIDKKDYDEEIFHFLKDQGLLSYSPHEAASLEEAYRNETATIKLPNFALDPIFSLMSDSNFITDQRFLSVNKRYLSTLDIVIELMNSNTSIP